MSAFFIKSVQSLAQGILGRREPHQLAWALALGLLLGIVPHGNLIAMVILLFILSVRVNHGMVAVTAVATTLVAAKLDAYTHVAGKYLLTHPDVAYHLSAAWQWPMVPWTDLNNTVVMGSLMFGLAAMVPTYLFSYPLFHALAPAVPVLPSGDTNPPTHSGADALSSRTKSTSGSFLRIDPPCEHAPLLEREDTAAVDAAFDDVVQAEQAARQITVDTRIEVVRIAPATTGAAATTRDRRALAELESATSETSQQDPPMSEALNYLLRQVRDSRQGRAA